MAGKGVHPARALVRQHARRFAQRTSGVNHVVHDDTVRVLHIAHQVHLGHLVGLGALLDDHGQARVEVVLVRQALAELLRPVHAARVRGDHHGVVQVLVPEVGHADDAPVQVVHRHARPKEPLDLPAVQVHGDDAIDPHGLQQPGHVRRRDGHPRRHFAVLARVAVVGDDGRDAARGRPAHGGHHQHQLQQVLVHRGAGGLDDVHVLAAHVLLDDHVHLPVREPVHLHAAEVEPEVVRDLAGQLGVPVAAEDLDSSGRFLRFHRGRPH
mmetsp:Transcript_20217/g.31850  ORF Transcript_20217/g.31850 Transcript_20217/m.31850 type:complete len:268 (-) Transcript_20217:343-1146(-)